MSERASLVAVLVEDRSQQQFVYHCLRKSGLPRQAIRLLPLPAGAGSGEKFVRDRFPNEVRAYRARAHRAATMLVAMVDADRETVDHRAAQLAEGLAAAGETSVGSAERIGVLIPRRHIETWVLALQGHGVDEEVDYKRSGRVTSEDIPEAGKRFFELVRQRDATPAPSSLARGATEARRIGLAGGR